jgi:signal transduction histidine kinase
MLAGTATIWIFRDPAQNSVGEHLGGLLWLSPILLAWLLGSYLRTRRAAEVARRATLSDREREERARVAVGDERARIARELHDAVGHSVSVMTVQASAVRRLLRPDQRRELDALNAVERTGREALAEMRQMVGVLRDAEEAPALAPQPGIDQVDRLVEQTGAAGLPVKLRVEGTVVPLSTGVSLTAYRLVQEGLTNALKHAQARQAEVLVRYGIDALEIIVSDDGHGEGPASEGGHGLIGMRERVSVYGGELAAGPRRGGGFELRARLPLAEA